MQMYAFIKICKFANETEIVYTIDIEKREKQGTLQGKKRGDAKEVHARWKRYKVHPIRWQRKQYIEN